MNLTGKIGKSILWSAIGYVTWLVVDHYTHWGMPSADPLTNFLAFFGIGAAIAVADQRKEQWWDWLLHAETGRKVLVVAGWMVSLPAAVAYFRAPAVVFSALPISIPTPFPVVIGAGAFLAWQAWRLAMWVLF